jgi:hypothetical protein
MNEIPPVAPIEYASQLPESRRPGIVTALGVLSIVFSLWMALMSLGTGAQVATFAFLGQVSASQAQPTGTSTLNAALTPGRAKELAQWISQAAQLDATQEWLLEGVLMQEGGLILADHALITSAQDLPAHLAIVPASPGGPVTLSNAAATVVIDAQSIVATVKDGPITRTITQYSSGSPTVNSHVQSPLPTMLVGMGPLILLAVDGVLSLAAAVLLLISGIRTLQSRKSGRRLHLIWAWIKIPLALFGGVAIGVVTAAMFDSIATTAPAGIGSMRLGWMGLLQGLMQAGFAMLYPVAVLIVLNLRPVRDWFASHAR